LIIFDGRPSKMKMETQKKERFGSDDFAFQLGDFRYHVKTLIFRAFPQVL